MYGVDRQSPLAPDLNDLVAEHRTYRTIDVDDRELQVDFLPVMDRIERQLYQSSIKRMVEAVVLLPGATDFDVLMRLHGGR